MMSSSRASLPGYTSSVQPNYKQFALRTHNGQIKGLVWQAATAKGLSRAQVLSRPAFPSNVSPSDKMQCYQISWQKVQIYKTWGCLLKINAAPWSFSQEKEVSRVMALCVWYHILHGLFPISSQHMLRICLCTTSILNQMLMPSSDLLQSHVHTLDFATGYPSFLPSQHLKGMIRNLVLCVFYCSFHIITQETLILTLWAQVCSSNPCLSQVSWLNVWFLTVCISHKWRKNQIQLQSEPCFSQSVVYPHHFSPSIPK